MLLSAIERIRGISAEFEECGRFTNEMKMRLALVQKDVNVLHHKYNILSSPDNRIDSILAANLTIPDLNLFTLSSVADIQVERLRFKLALQDNPDDAHRSLAMLDSKIDRYAALFEEALKRDSVKEYKKELQDSLDDMNWWQRNISGRKLTKESKDKIATLYDIGERRLDTIRQLARCSQDIRKGRGVGHEHSIVYYRENNGKGDLKAYYTGDWSLQKYSDQ